MDKLKIEYWDIERLQPYARNPRRNDEAVPRMAGLIREFGFRVPVIIRSSGEVIDGHLRLKAAWSLGMTQVPVVIADDWSEAQVKAFRLAVNRSAEWAQWDDDLLKLELEDLRLADFDLELIGFDVDELDAGGTGMEEHGSLADKFGFAPFSVLDARSGQWQQRKQAWLALGIDSELGRGGDYLSLAAAVLAQKEYKNDRGKGLGLR